MDDNIHKGHRARLRNRVLNHGMEHMEDYQVLEYILSFVIPQKDTNPVAHRLINTFGSLKNVLEADPKTLMQVNGIGEVTALFINTYMGVYYHYERNKSDEVVVINTPSEAGTYYRNLLQNKSNELVYLTLLDSKNKVIYSTKLADGSYDSVDVTPRSVLSTVLQHKAQNVLLCHNHPDARPMPSSSDIRFTKDLVLLLAINDVRLLDHVIIGKGSYYSFQSSHRIDEYEKDAKDILSGKNRKYKEYMDEDKYNTDRGDSDDKK